MNLMAGQTRNGRLVELGRILQRPRTIGGQRRDEILDVAVKKHAMTTETFRGHLLHLIVFRIQKDLRVSRRMTTALPIRITPGVTFAAGLLQGQHLGFREADGGFR